MATSTKLFLDQNGLIELLSLIEALDSNNIKDFYWSTDNNVSNPTIVFKIGDKLYGDKHVGYTTKEITFKGDIDTAPTGATTRYIKLTIGGVDKLIPYYYLNKQASGDVSYSYTSDTNAASSANTVKQALDRVITKLNALKSTDVKMNAAISELNITTSDTVQSAFEKVNTAISNIDPADEKVRQTTITGNGAASVTSPVNMLFGNAANGLTGEAYTGEAQYYPEIRAIKLIQNYNNQSTPVWLANGGLAFGGASTPSTTDYINKDNYTGKALQTETDLKAYYQDPDVVGSGGNSGAAHIGYTDINEYLQSDNVAGALLELAAAIYDSDSDAGLAARVTTLEGKTVNLTSTLFNGNSSTATTATNLANNPTVSLSSANGSSGLTITVTAGGKSGTSGALATGSTSVYGVVKLGTTESSNSTDVATVSVVKTLISNLSKAQFVRATTLPTLTLPSAQNTDPNSLYYGKIYLIPDNDYGTLNNRNIYKEYILVHALTNSVMTDLWELLGDTDTTIDADAIPVATVASLFTTYVTNNSGS